MLLAFSGEQHDDHRRMVEINLLGGHDRYRGLFSISSATAAVIPSTSRP